MPSFRLFDFLGPDPRPARYDVPELLPGTGRFQSAFHSPDVASAASAAPAFAPRELTGVVHKAGDNTAEKAGEGRCLLGVDSGAHPGECIGPLPCRRDMRSAGAGDLSGAESPPCHLRLHGESEAAGSGRFECSASTLRTRFWIGDSRTGGLPSSSGLRRSVSKPPMMAVPASLSEDPISCKSSHAPGTELNGSRRTLNFDGLGPYLLIGRGLGVGIGTNHSGDRASSSAARPTNRRAPAQHRVRTTPHPHAHETLG